jgi:hypothetical protein
VFTTTKAHVAMVIKIIATICVVVKKTCSNLLVSSVAIYFAASLLIVSQLFNSGLFLQVSYFQVLFKDSYLGLQLVFQVSVVMEHFLPSCVLKFVLRIIVVSTLLFYDVLFLSIGFDFFNFLFLFIGSRS